MRHNQKICNVVHENESVKTQCSKLQIEVQRLRNILLNPDKPYDKHEDKLTLQMFTKTQENNNDPVKTHIIGNEIGNNQLKLEKMEYHGTKNLNILDSLDQQKERFQFTKPTIK